MTSNPRDLRCIPVTINSITTYQLLTLEVPFQIHFLVGIAGAGSTRNRSVADLYCTRDNANGSAHNIRAKQFLEPSPSK
jgi:hypothetical protein